MLGVGLLFEMMVRAGLGLHIDLWDMVSAVFGLGLLSKIMVR